MASHGEEILLPHDFALRYKDQLFHNIIRPRDTGAVAKQVLFASHNAKLLIWKDLNVPIFSICNAIKRVASNLVQSWRGWPKS